MAVRGMNMTRRLLPGVVAALALVFAGTASTASTATATVQITSTRFAPASVTINANDSVTWKNADTKRHQVVANGGQFVSPILDPGKTYTHAFARGGTFHYHDGLFPARKGTVVVRGAPPSVTLAASAPLVKYGAQVMLIGAVSNKKAGETVTLVQEPYGQTTKQVVATLQTAANGTFSFAVTPQVYTTYQAQWKNSESSVVVQVMPMIKLPMPVRGYFHFYVTAATSFAGHWVYLQRYSTTLHKWLSYRRLVLGSKSGRIFPVTYAPRHHRTNLRIYMTADQVGAGYQETWSGSQPVTRR
jgi:plastocyanin